MVDEKPTLRIYCKFCEEECDQEFIGENRKDTFSLTFVCKSCGNYHTFEFFGSQFVQPTELD